jgi:hypothetical protein
LDSLGGEVSFTVSNPDCYRETGIESGGLWCGFALQGQVAICPYNAICMGDLGYAYQLPLAAQVPRVEPMVKGSLKDHLSAGDGRPLECNLFGFSYCMLFGRMQRELVSASSRLLQIKSYCLSLGHCLNPLIVCRHVYDDRKFVRLDLQLEKLP